MSVDKMIESFAQYGLLGLTLCFIGIMLFFGGKYFTVNIIKPMVDSYVTQQIKLVDSQVEINKQMAVFMNVMANHAVAEERLMTTIAETQTRLAESQNRIALTKDSIELIASDLRAQKQKLTEIKIP